MRFPHLELWGDHKYVALCPFNAAFICTVSIHCRPVRDVNAIILGCRSLRLQIAVNHYIELYDCPGHALFAGGCALLFAILCKRALDRLRLEEGERIIGRVTWLLLCRFLRRSFLMRQSLSQTSATFSFYGVFVLM